MASFTARDGLRIAYSLAAGSPRVVLAHATGFCKELWGPVTALLPGFGTLAVDQRGHGDSEAGAPPFDWWDLGRDVVEAIGTAGWERPLGVGHSSGAASLILAELEAPGTFAGLLLIEPIVFPPPYVRYEHLPLAQKAARRRASFADRGAARDGYRGRGPFARWADAALEAYLDGGFDDSGGEFRLKCPPEVEAEAFRAATLHGAWDRLGEIGCPAVVVAGADSDSHPPAFVAELAGRMPDGTAEIIDEATHFVPMERTEVIAAMIGDLAAGVAG